MKSTLQLIFIILFLAIGIPQATAQFPKIKKPKIKKPKLEDIIETPVEKENPTENPEKEVKEKEPEVINNLKFGAALSLRRCVEKEEWNDGRYLYSEKLVDAYEYVDQWEADGKADVDKARAFLQPYKDRMLSNPRPMISMILKLDEPKYLFQTVERTTNEARDYYNEKVDPNWESVNRSIKSLTNFLDKLDKDIPEVLPQHMLESAIDTAHLMVSENRVILQKYVEEVESMQKVIEETKSSIKSTGNEENAIITLYQKTPNDNQNHPDKVGKILFSKTEDLSSEKASFSINDAVYANIFLEESAANTLKEMYKTAPDSDKKSYEFIGYQKDWETVAFGKSKYVFTSDKIYVRPIYKIYINGKEWVDITSSQDNVYSKEDEKFDMYNSSLHVSQKLCGENATFNELSNRDFQGIQLPASLLIGLHGAVYKAGPGNHDIKIEFYISPNDKAEKIKSKLLASGSFQYNATGAEFEAFKQKNQPRIGKKGNMHSDARVAEVKQAFANSGLPGTIQKVHITSHGYKQEFINDNTLREYRSYKASLILNINGKCGVFSMTITQFEKGIDVWKPAVIDDGNVLSNPKSIDYFSTAIDCK